MPYITVVQSSHTHQITFDEIILGDYKLPQVFSNCEFNTRTFFVPEVSEKMRRQIDTTRMTRVLSDFITKHGELYKVPRHSLYHKFYIPKKTGA